MYFIRIIFVFLCLYSIAHAVLAQENSLEAVEDPSDAISGILGGEKKGVTDVRLISDTEQAVSIEIDYKGFEEKSKVKGYLLNKMKKPVAEIVGEEKVLSKGDGTVDMKFQFKQGNGNYTNTSLETHFISLSFTKSDGLLSGLDLGDDAIFGDVYVYKLNKRWRVSGSEAMVITVKLTPFKSAASIQP
jgi:hypothetical protein